MTRPPIPLSELEGELIRLTEDGETNDAVMFLCPNCGDHYCAVPYDIQQRRTPAGSPVWRRVSGTTLDDITLAPSYHLPTSPCKLHGYVRNGSWVTC